jgi:hypothetical protein
MSASEGAGYRRASPATVKLASPSSRHRSRWSRTSRCGRARLSNPLMFNAPVISDNAPYQKPESGEERRQPRPKSGLAGPSTRRIVAVRIVVAGIRHVSFPSLGPACADKQMANCPECSCPPRRAFSTQWFRTLPPSVAPLRPAPARRLPPDPKDSSSGLRLTIEMMQAIFAHHGAPMPGPALAAVAKKQQA